MTIPWALATEHSGRNLLASGQRANCICNVATTWRCDCSEWKIGASIIQWVKLLWILHPSLAQSYLKTVHKQGSTLQKALDSIRLACRIATSSSRVRSGMPLGRYGLYNAWTRSSSSLKMPSLLSAEPLLAAFSSLASLQYEQNNGASKSTGCKPLLPQSDALLCTMRQGLHASRQEKAALSRPHRL